MWYTITVILLIIALYVAYRTTLLVDKQLASEEGFDSKNDGSAKKVSAQSATKTKLVAKKTKVKSVTK
ncbi:MAG: hypothetical protein COB50_00870 [Thiotrichales bacterium]|nr:MAG: hypothetical protein COB50_00870 [Thiotrichales bacterium]